MKIKKIKIIDLKSIKNPKGDILKYLSKDSKYYKNSGRFIFLKLKKIKKRMEFTQN